MGRGNCCTTGPYEGLYYIDNDDIHVYRRDDEQNDEIETRLLRDLDYEELTSGHWYLDEIGTSEEEGDILECFIQDFCKIFPSFKRAKKEYWLARGDKKVILQSALFYIALEDNEWSLAVELIQKEESWGMVWMNNLQKRLYMKYLDGIKKCLLNRLPSISYRRGPWMSGTIYSTEN